MEKRHIDINPDEEYTPKEVAGFVKRRVRSIYTLISKKRVVFFELNGRYTIKGAEILKIMNAAAPQENDA